MLALNTFGSLVLRSVLEQVAGEEAATALGRQLLADGATGLLCHKTGHKIAEVEVAQSRFRGGPSADPENIQNFTKICLRSPVRGPGGPKIHCFLLRFVTCFHHFVQFC